MSLFIPDSAGERFGAVLRTRQVGEFLMRLSRYGGDRCMPVHHHPHAYFSFVARGGLDEWSKTGESRFEPGSVHFHPPRDPHRGRTSPSGMTSLSIVPLGTVADRILSERPRLCGPQTSAMRWSAARCYHAFEESDDISDLCAEAAALELVAALLRQADAGMLRHKPRWLETVRSFLDRHFTDSTPLRELAALAGVHEIYLVRAFRRHVGATPGTYVRRLRVEAARTELLSSAKPIAEIALAAGFSSQAHLTRIFHREIGLPPAAYRRRYRRTP